MLPGRQQGQDQAQGGVGWGRGVEGAYCALAGRAGQAPLMTPDLTSHLMASPRKAHTGTHVHRCRPGCGLPPLPCPPNPAPPCPRSRHRVQVPASGWWRRTSPSPAARAPPRAAHPWPSSCCCPTAQCCRRRTSCSSAYSSWTQTRRRACTDPWPCGRVAEAGAGLTARARQQHGRQRGAGGPVLGPCPRRGGWCP